MTISVDNVDAVGNIIIKKERKRPVGAEDMFYRHFPGTPDSSNRVHDFSTRNSSSFVELQKFSKFNRRMGKVQINSA